MSPARGAEWLAIVNPASGNARGRSAWTQCEQALRKRGVAFESVETTGAHDGQRIARRALEQGRRRLIAVGGDGSVHDVVNGIMSAGLPADDRVTMAQAPFGTGNDWARGLGLPRTADGIAELIERDHSRPHDVGLLQFPRAADSARTSHWFINVAGAGFDAFVAERLQGRKRSSVTYFAGVLRGLLAYEAPDFTVTVPGRGAVLRAPLLVAFVAIGSHCGGGMCVAPRSSRQDGLLDLVAIRDAGLLGTLVRLRRLYDGSLLEDKVVTHALADRVRVETATRVAVQADGQVVGYAPFEASVCRQAIDVLSPVPLASPGPPM